MVPGRVPRTAPAFAALAGVATGVALVLVIFAGGYGYHRDELYFLAAGHHLAWGYADQGPLTPLLAHMMDVVAPGSLTVLRLPSALMAGATVCVTGLIAFAAGARRRAQTIAASCAAVASVLLVVGHLLSTSTFDLLAWSIVTWLVARVIRTRDERLWLLTGVVAGIALLNKPLIAFLLAGLGVGLVDRGPASSAPQRLALAGLGIAALLWSPWLIWQASHGWPELDVSLLIAAGIRELATKVGAAAVPVPARQPRARSGLDRRRSGSSAPPAAAGVPSLPSGLAVPGRSVSRHRGKPYYLAGLFPVLLAAGAIEDRRLAHTRRTRWRGTLLWSMIVLSGLVSAVIALPLLPVRNSGPVIAVNGDVGETIGWPDLTRTVASVYRRAGSGAVTSTSNYGEAGAIDRYGPALGLPAAYSGHTRSARARRLRIVSVPWSRWVFDASQLQHFRGLPARRSHSQLRGGRQ